MEVVNIEKLKRSKEKLAVAIGFFDGVHLGHQKVINHATVYAKENQTKSMVITFDRSPKVALGHDRHEGYVTPIKEKLRILENLDVDYALVLKFDASFLNLSADAFIRDYLLKAGACYVSVGFDFRFGHDGMGSAKYLMRHGDFKVNITEAVLMAGTKVSTRLIKHYLKMGDLNLVNQMLGRPFSVSGSIVYGQQLGRKIGFPTANLKLDADYFLSLRGVYATLSYIDGVCYKSMTNVGYNPTINELSAECVMDGMTVETYILDFNKEVYGKTLRVEFIQKIRDEVKFDGLDALVAQLEKDKLSIKFMSI